MATAVCEACASEYEEEALPEFEEEYESELEGEFEDEAEGEGWLGTIGNVVGSLLGESEFEGEEELEDELEGEDEFEEELSPIRKVYPDAMMEHLGELAAEAETEEEAAEHFLPLIGMAASKLLPVVAKAVAPAAKRALPRIAKTVSRLTPHLTRGVGKIARTLHRQPGTRKLLRAVPAIARRTVHNVARQAAQGRRVTPRLAIRTLARQTRRVLGHPRHRLQALRRHHRMERRFHRRMGRGLARPHWMWRWINGRRVRVPYRPRYRRGVAGPMAVSPAGAPRRVVTRASAPGMRYGRLVDGRCVCAACPSCGAPATVAATPAAIAAPAPAYCRCCGQVLR
jgi:hypothetical protein